MMDEQSQDNIGEIASPRTPQPPFSLPCRSSSLAFAATRNGRQCSRGSAAEQFVGTDPDDATVRRRTLATPTLLQVPQTGHQQQTQDFLRVARASVHKDMLVASSPAGSIEARMQVDNNPTVSGPVFPDPDIDVTAWRYSTAPAEVARWNMDVREPLPSPTLPDTRLSPEPDIEELIEPMSSGFCSPHKSDHSLGNTSSLSTTDEAEADNEPVLQALDTSDGELNQDMNNLQVSTESIVSDLRHPSVMTGIGVESLDESMVVVANSPTNSIYLSETAEAAAQSAKAKRKLLKHIFDDDLENGEPGPTIMMHAAPNEPKLPPSGMTLHSVEMEGLPDIPRPPVSPRSLPPIEQHSAALPYGFVPGMSRATATGSPMPFDRLHPRPGTAQPRRPGPRSYHNPYGHNDDHFDNRSPFNIRPPNKPMYSFSTAASKAVGSDQAPDSRIRDSYKTDTLTALARPTSRYRKNGIGAELPSRGVGRYYHRPPSSMRPQSSWSRPSSRQTYAGPGDVRFRSSPPRGPGSERYIKPSRKRALDDSFLAMKENIHPASHMQPNVNLDANMELDEDMKAAVRLSIFGTNTPEALRKAREGIRDLSPNVMVYRKGTQEQSHLRKKRRPSYWDNDLQEVRNSPAGFGGVNSPVSAKQSLKAEVEMATELALDEVEHDGDIGDGPSMDVDG